MVCMIAGAQEHITTDGYMLDEYGSLEVLDTAVLTESKVSEKVLEGKGMRLAGGVVSYESGTAGAELGSIVKTRHPFLVRSIDFTVLDNQIDGCRAVIRIYKIGDGDKLENIVTMPIVQDIPVSDDKRVFRIAPSERVVLEAGRYYISFSIRQDALEVTQDKMHFPLYVKSSYRRVSPDSPLEKCGYNIGLTVRGCRTR